jgi:hypothetical protein
MCGKQKTSSSCGVVNYGFLFLLLFDPEGGGDVVPETSIGFLLTQQSHIPEGRILQSPLWEFYSGILNCSSPASFRLDCTPQI